MLNYIFSQVAGDLVHPAPRAGRTEPPFFTTECGNPLDGYWYIPVGDSYLVFALEVEFSIKDKKDYGPIGRSYLDTPKISRVVWLVKSQSKALLLQSIFREIDPKNYGKHIFILQSDFKKGGWNAPIVVGYEKDDSVRFALCAGQKRLMEWVVNGSAAFPTHSLPDTSKCALESIDSQDSNGTGFLNSMAIQPYSHT